mmetsp:Transcript_42211/g.96180  ORF Transcript_42211/g.96180 Transcript_42211/m.96180 type:complete len:258 (-) Transcript_42211:660-1433(-)
MGVPHVVALPSACALRNITPHWSAMSFQRYRAREASTMASRISATSSSLLVAAVTTESTQRRARPASPCTCTGTPPCGTPTGGPRSKSPTVSLMHDSTSRDVMGIAPMTMARTRCGADTSGREVGRRAKPADAKVRAICRWESPGLKKTPVWLVNLGNACFISAYHCDAENLASSAGEKPWIKSSRGSGNSGRASMIRARIPAHSRRRMSAPAVGSAAKINLCGLFSVCRIIKGGSCSIAWPERRMQGATRLGIPAA